jgi:hypothetical protein
MKRSIWCSLPRQVDHGRGDVHAKDTIASIGQVARPDPTATSEIDDKPIMDAVFTKDIEQARRGALGETTVADIMNVCQIVTVSRNPLHGAGIGVFVVHLGSSLIKWR